MDSSSKFLLFSFYHHYMTVVQYWYFAYRSFQNGCLPNEIYHSIIDGIGTNNNWRRSQDYQTLCRCSLVCKTWSQRAINYLHSTISIQSFKQLLKCAKTKHHNLVHTLFVYVEPMDDVASRYKGSLIGITLLLISKLPNLRKLDITCDWFDNHHPRMLKLLSNTSVKTLHCDFRIRAGGTQPILQFITYFHSLQHLSLSLRGHPGIKSSNRAFHRRLPKTKICLKELHLWFPKESFKDIIDAFIGATDFASSICKLTYSIPIDRINSYQNLLLHCSSSVQIFGINRYGSESGSFISGKS